MPRSRFHNWAQFALELEQQKQRPPVITCTPEGLLGALAELLLGALGVEATMTKEDGDDRQNHT